MSLAGALEPAARIAVATLFNSLWEAALLVLVVALALRVFPNVSATTRYAAWCVALVGALLLPLATALPQITVQQPIAAPLQHHVELSRHQAAARVLPAGPQRTAPAQTSNTAPSSLFRLPERVHFALPQYVALAVFLAWCLAALLLLVRLAVNLWRLERLKTDALPLPVEYRERLERWSSAEKGEREIRLCTCDGIEVPVAVGLFDSMILIPQHLLDTLSQSEIDQIILHELAHLRRADDWTNGLQRIIQALFFFNPAVLYIAQQLDVEREVACDDWVVDQTKEVRPYATCLTKMAEATAWPHSPLAAPGVFVTRRGLSVRVERLLRAGRNIRTSIAFGPTGGIVAALIVLFFILQNVAPSFAFTLAQTQIHTQTQAHASVPSSHKSVALVAKAVASPSPAPKESHVLVIPGTHVHVPAQTIHVPAVDVDTPPQRVPLPPTVPSYARSYAQTNAPYYAHKYAHVWASMAPDFAKNLSSSVSKTVSGAMAQAFKGGNYSCVGCDWSGQNLSGHSFRGQKLNGADFSRANLRNADFSYSTLVGVDFSGADLRGATFSHANLTGCDLSDAHIDGVNFDDVNMVGCDVNARALAPHQAGMLLRGCHTGCDFSYADLSGQDLRDVELTGIDLSHANLSGADLSGARLEGVDFTHARLDGARLNGTDFTGCDFSGVDMHAVNFSNARITGSKMDGDQ